MTDYNSAYTGAQVDAAVAAHLVRKRAIISDTKTANTAGGTFTAGAWQTRDLNTEDYDPDGIVGISSNQFTLQAGTYIIRASAPAVDVAAHKARLQNITDAATVAIGTSEYTDPTTAYVVTRSQVVCVVTIAAAKAFEIQHYCQTTRATAGFGAQSNFGVSEKYTLIEIDQIA